MNYDVSKENLSVIEPAFEGCKEVPLDIDFTLPDYCPDIQKILKCSVKPNITSRNISGGQIAIDGNAEIKIIYIDALSAKMRCCENSANFSASIDISGSAENPVIFTTAKTEYMNCRAVSPRKIDLHGAVSICAKVYHKNNLEISSSVSGKDIEQKIEKISVSDLAGLGQQQFSVSETLEVNDGKPSPEMIIDSDVTFLSSDPKIMPNKVVVKGNFIVKILYIGDMDSGTTEKLEYQIPVSQIVDVPGVSEDSECITKLEILDHKVNIPKNENSEGGENLISIDIKAAATVFAFSPKEIDAVLDVYSREREVKNTFTPLNTQKISKNFTEELSFQDKIEIPNVKIKEIVNITPTISATETVLKGEKIVFKGKLKLGILGIDNEELPIYAERTIDFEINSNQTADSENTHFKTEIIPSEIKIISQNDGTIEFKINVIVSTVAYQKQNVNMVTDVEADESENFAKNQNPSVTVYFSDGNESLWDIARKYHSSVNSIKEENNISEDISEGPQMILIPSK